MSQEDATLRMLREAGSRGVHTFEMRAAFIGNPSERIARLERRGHRISVSEREQLAGGAFGVRYFLDFDAETGRPLSEAPEPVRGQQADRGSVPSTEGARSAAPAQSLFDAGTFGRGSYRDAA